MCYLNSDGGEVAMCANGIRALAHFINEKKSPTKKECLIETLNGTYRTQIQGEIVQLEMSELYDEDTINPVWFKKYKRAYYLNTGVPHIVLEVDDVDKIDVSKLGPLYAHDKLFRDGTNVNFCSLPNPGQVMIRTFERGVENETLSCGTGIVACAIALNHFYDPRNEWIFSSPGGELKVIIKEKIYLSGMVEKIFTGQL